MLNIVSVIDIGNPHGLYKLSLLFKLNSKGFYHPLWRMYSANPRCDYINCIQQWLSMKKTDEVHLYEMMEAPNLQPCTGLFYPLSDNAEVLILQFVVIIEK